MTRVHERPNLTAQKATGTTSAISRARYCGRPGSARMPESRMFATAPAPPRIARPLPSTVAISPRHSPFAVAADGNERAPLVMLALLQDQPEVVQQCRFGRVAAALEPPAEGVIADQRHRHRVHGEHPFADQQFMLLQDQAFLGVATIPIIAAIAAGGDPRLADVQSVACQFGVDTQPARGRYFV